MRKQMMKLAIAALTIAAAFAQQKTITPPKIGAYTVGDDYFLANYTQLLEYWNKLSKESDRMKLVEIGKTRTLMYYQGVARPSRPLVIAIVFWLTLTFFSWGLYARPNATVVFAIAMAALAVASALLVIGEMYAPYEGLIHVSTAPLHAALAMMGR